MIFWNAQSKWKNFHSGSDLCAQRSHPLSKRNKFDVVLGLKSSNLQCEKACLPTKSHGCGFGKPKDIISAAFAANVEETMDAVQNILPGTTTHMEMIHAADEDFNAFHFPSDDIEPFVDGALKHNGIVTSVRCRQPI